MNQNRLQQYLSSHKTKTKEFLSEKKYFLIKSKSNLNLTLQNYNNKSILSIASSKEYEDSYLRAKDQVLAQKKKHNQTVNQIQMQKTKILTLQEENKNLKNKILELGSKSLNLPINKESLIINLKEKIKELEEQKYALSEEISQYKKQPIILEINQLSTENDELQRHNLSITQFINEKRSRKTSHQQSDQENLTELKLQNQNHVIKIESMQRQIDRLNILHSNKTLKLKQSKTVIDKLSQIELYVERSKIIQKKTTEIKQLNEKIEQQEEESNKLYKFINDRKDLIDDLRLMAQTIPGLKHTIEMQKIDIEDLNNQANMLTSLLEEEKNLNEKLIINAKQIQSQQLKSSKDDKFVKNKNKILNISQQEKRKILLQTELKIVQYNLRFHLREQQIPFDDIEDYFCLKNQQEFSIHELIKLLNLPPFEVPQKDSQLLAQYLVETDQTQGLLDLHSTQTRMVVVSIFKTFIGKYTICFGDEAQDLIQQVALKITHIKGTLERNIKYLSKKKFGNEDHFIITDLVQQLNFSSIEKDVLCDIIYGFSKEIKINRIIFFMNIDQIVKGKELNFADKATQEHEKAYEFVQQHQKEFYPFKAQIQQQNSMDHQPKVSSNHQLNQNYDQNDFEDNKKSKQKIL